MSSIKLNREFSPGANSADGKQGAMRKEPSATLKALRYEGYNYEKKYRPPNQIYEDMFHAGYGKQIPGNQFSFGRDTNHGTNIIHKRLAHVGSSQ